MELVVYAPVFGQSGFESLSRNLLIALDQMGVNIALRPAQEWNQERIALSPNTLNRLIRMCNTKVSDIAPHVIYQLPRSQPIGKGAPTICYSLFETDRCPAPWIQSLLKMDKILVFSEFNRKGWSSTGIPANKISALPPAIDSFLYNPNGPRYEIAGKKGFTFLTSGDFTERKNFDDLIEAFVTEFSSMDPVTLIVKCHYAGFTKRFRRDCVAKLTDIINRFNAKDPPRVLFYGDKISDHAMAALYRSVDCFVLASRGEGLGMQYLEAMASGVPVIACDWSAQSDYLNNSNSYLVAGDTRIIDDPNYIMKCPQALNSKWFHVDVENLRQTMRHVVNHYDEAKKKSLVALEWVRTKTWHGMALEFIKQVINMYDGRPS